MPILCPDQGLLRLKNVTNMDLLVGRCPNDHLNIFGFYHQFRDEEKHVDLEAMTVTITQNCRECCCRVKTVLSVIWDARGLINGDGI